MRSELKAFIVRWNNDHPLDRRFREKYKLSFNSPQHRETNQFDILLEYIESSLIAEYEAEINKAIEKEKLYQKGIWLSENVTEEQSIDLFDQLDLSQLNGSQLQVDE